MNAASDPGRAAYEAHFAHARPRDAEPWDSLTPEVRAIWARVEAAAGAVMRARCMEVVQAVYDGWARNNPEEKWPCVALSNAMVQIRQIHPQIKEG